MRAALNSLLTNARDRKPFTFWFHTLAGENSPIGDLPYPPKGSTLITQSRQTQTGKSAKRGAGWGAMAGLVFGDSVWDVAEGAAVGAAGGAAYGAVKGNEMEKKYQNDIAYSESQQRLRLEQERNYILAQQKVAESRGQTQVVNSENWMTDRTLLERAFGVDNVNGLYELRDCQHSKAQINALAGANSDMLSHRLASIWLEAMIAEDQRDSTRAQRAYQQIVAQDASVVSVDQARAETVDALAAVRSDRRAMGISCS